MSSKRLQAPEGIIYVPSAAFLTETRKPLDILLHAVTCELFLPTLSLARELSTGGNYFKLRAMFPSLPLRTMPPAPQRAH